MVKEKKRIWLILPALLAAVLLGSALKKPIYNFYRDISFSWEERSPEEHKIKAYAETMGISYGEYPEFIIELLENNPETEAFVLNYPFREELPLVLPEQGGLFLQWDPMWGYEPYGSSVIAVTGCGPTCLAMAGYTLTGEARFDPVQVAAFAEREGYYEKGYGSSWTLISEGAGKLGLTAAELPLVKKKMTSALESGSLVILALGPGDFTTAGHYILLTGVEDGRFRVHDPNSRIRSERLWSYEELEVQIRNIWAIGR